MDQQTLTQFDNDRSYLVSSLYRDPQTFASTLYSETISGNFWNQQITTFSPYLTMNNVQLCCLIGASSTNIKPNICLHSKITPLSKGKEGEALLITSGGFRQPQYFILKVFELNRPEVYFFKLPISGLSYLGNSSQIQLCLYPNIDNLQYIGSDNFTNEYLVGFILSYIYSQITSKAEPAIRRLQLELRAQGGGGFNQFGTGQEIQQTSGIYDENDESINRVQNENNDPINGLNGVIKFLSATICNSGKRRRGTIIMEYADLGDIYNFVKNPLGAEFRNTLNFSDQDGNSVTLQALKNDVIVDIFKQVIANLEFLHEKVEFNHGDFKANNILIQSTPSTGNYRGLNWKSSFTVKFADFAKSSLTIIDSSGIPVRLFNYSSSAETYLGVFPFRPSLGTQFEESYYLLDTSTNVSLLARIRHMGIPYYYSFDTYTFMISLLMIPEIYYPIMTNVTLRKVIWDNLWFEDDYSTAWSRLFNAIKEGKNAYGDILVILSGLKLKCRANTILVDALKNLQ
jgi:hypothetical protein